MEAKKRECPLAPARNFLAVVRSHPRATQTIAGGLALEWCDDAESLRIAFRPNGRVVVLLETNELPCVTVEPAPALDEVDRQSVVELLESTSQATAVTFALKWVKEELPKLIRMS